MIDVLREKCGVYTTSAEKEVVRTIKEKECYVCLDYEEELKKFDERPNEILTNFELPDGNIIQLGTERFRGPECLFNPMQVGIEADSLSTMLYSSTFKSDIDIRKCLCSNIVLSGGTTTTKGLPERLKKEMTNLVPLNAPIKIIADKNRKFIVWQGGSLLASMEVFNDGWISRDEYEENG